MLQLTEAICYCQPKLTSPECVHIVSQPVPAHLFLLCHVGESTAIYFEPAVLFTQAKP